MVDLVSPVGVVDLASPFGAVNLASPVGVVVGVRGKSSSHACRRKLTNGKFVDIACYSMTRYHKLAYAYRMNYLFTGHQELSQMYSI